jgi:hypothetical protein
VVPPLADFQELLFTVAVLLVVNRRAEQISKIPILGKVFLLVGVLLALLLPAALSFIGVFYFVGGFENGLPGL